jgi:hypothetical protein
MCKKGFAQPEKQFIESVSAEFLSLVDGIIWK